MVGNLPLAVFVGVDVGVAGLDLVTQKIELINSTVHAVVVALDNVGFQNDALGLLFQKFGKVCLDGLVVGTRSIRNGGKEDRFLGVTLGDGIGIQGCQGVVPKMEQTGHFGICNRRNDTLNTSRCVEETKGDFWLVDSRRKHGLLGSLVGDSAGDDLGEVALKHTN